MTRHCNCCDTTKPVAEFYPTYKTQCKACLKSKAAVTRDQKVAYLRRWRENNPNAYREWHQKNREKRSRYMERWHSENRTHRSETYAQWARDNRDKVYAIIAKRRAAKCRAAVSWANHGEIAAVYRASASLTHKTGIRHEVDHIYPLISDWVCGLHWEANLQILTKTENIRKSNRKVAVAA